MLYAELYGKLDPESSALARREDILTSTVFGTLIAANAVDTLRAWLNRARPLGTDGRLSSGKLGVEVSPLAFWFWPSMVACEPDVLLRIGSHLLVIEAKYGSRKSGTASAIHDPEIEEELPLPDQLLRQWISIQSGTGGIDLYEEQLQGAINECEPHLIYLVSRRAYGSAVRELNHSQEKIHECTGHSASLWLLTWQDLHAVLRVGMDSSQADPRWSADLARLLEKRGLSAFLGFPGAIPGSRRISAAVESWGMYWGWTKKGDFLGAMRGIDLHRLHRSVRVIEGWRATAVRAGSLDKGHRRRRGKG